MKKAILFVFLIVLTVLLYPQNGTPFITYFDECVDIEVQNWAISQDSDNVMLFANRQGLLSYDGFRWELDRLSIIPIAISHSPVDGRTYIGSNSNYGYIQNSSEHKPEYISLSGDSIELGFITDIFFNDTSVIFYSEKTISQYFINNSTRSKRWYSEDEFPFTGMMLHAEKLFFNVKDKGLFRIESDTLFPLVTGYLTADKEILFSIPYNDDKILIGTDDNKIQLFDRIKYYNYPIENSEFLEENILSDAVVISDSLIAFSSLYGGILIVNKGLARW